VSVRDDLLRLVEPVVESEGFQLVDVEYLKEGPRWVVRLYLHHRDGVSLNDCQRVSDAVSALLDVEDVVKTAYHLEVSSPGAERILKLDREYRIFEGRLIRCALTEPWQDSATGKAEQVVHGHLGPVTAGTLQMTTLSGQTISLPREQVKQVRLALKSSVPATK
jgi:ribosome maturation factor RimP